MATPKQWWSLIRKAAVRYKLAIDKFVTRRGYGLRHPCVSGSVQDPESGPGDFTESTMNPGVHDLRTAFRGDQYRVMIVANKFQTGFDQPLLCAMYVDRIRPASPPCKPCRGSTAPIAHRQGYRKRRY